MELKLKSKKMIQSEVGAIGECSDNIQLVVAIRDAIADNFKVTDGDLSEDDSYLLLCSVRGGVDVSGEKLNTLCACHGGSMLGVRNSIMGLLHNRPELIAVFLDAVMGAIYDQNAGR